MDHHWPSDWRSEISSQVTKKGRRRVVLDRPDNINAHPTVEYGRLSACTLLESAGKYTWTPAITSREALPSGISTPHNIFPATRSPSPRIPFISIKQRSEHGANFLRTYFPDIDITADLIREEITQDMKITEIWKTFDTLMGNAIALATRPVSGNSIMMPVFLAFPMGELHSDLNLSPFRFHQASQAVVFKPTHAPIWSFQTPIQQIAVSKITSNSSHEQCFLGVRTLGRTSLLESSLKHGRLSGITEIKIFSASLPEGKIQDLCFGLDGVLTVNDQGLVAGYNIASQQHTRMFTCDPVADSFYRILVPRARQLLLASSSRLDLFDARGREASVLYAADSGFITSAEHESYTDLTRISTTSQLQWIDHRYPKRPVLSIKHGRQPDRTLATFSVEDGRSFLTSRKNSLVTIYDTTFSESRPLQLQSSTPCFNTTVSSDVQSIGHTFLRTEAGTSLFRLSSSGRVDRVDIGNSVESPFQVLEWPREVHDLDKRAKHLSADDGKLGIRERVEHNLTSAYDLLFRQFFEQRITEEAKRLQDFENLMGSVPLFWQAAGPPVEHILTTYDLIFRSGEDPTASPRSDFLASSLVNSSHAFQAIGERRLSPEKIGRLATWTYNLQRVMGNLDASLVEPHSLFDLERTNTTGASCPLPWEQIAREELAVDLALANDVHSSQSFAASQQSDRLERLTEALRLDSEPPAFRFSFLQPVSRHDPEEVDAPSGSPELPLGVRLLLEDWELSADPNDFVYIDPYGNKRVPNEAAYQERPNSIQPIKQRLPPKIVAASSMLAGLDGFPQSQPTFSSTARIGQSNDVFDSYSQDTFVNNSQPLPGPYGGRPKKKPPKKRLGGF